MLEHVRIVLAVDYKACKSCGWKILSLFVVLVRVLRFRIIMPVLIPFPLDY